MPGISGDSPYDGNQEGKSGNCEETDRAWSHCEPCEQGKSGLILKCVHWNSNRSSDIIVYVIIYAFTDIGSGVTLVAIPFPEY